MKNIKSRKEKLFNLIIASDDKHSSKFITGYKTEKKGIQLKGESTANVMATSENIERIENKMIKQSKRQITKVLPQIKKEMIFDSALLGLSIIPFAGAGHHILSPNSDETIARALVCTGLAAFTFAALLLASDAYKKEKIEKYKFYYENEEKLNSSVENSHNTLIGVSPRAKNAIINSREKNLINVNNLDNMSLRDLRKIRDNIKFQEEMQFDLDNPIVRKK